MVHCVYVVHCFLRPRTLSRQLAAQMEYASIDPLNRRSTSVYNNVGAGTDSVNPAGSRSTLVYNIAGQTVASVNAQGARSTTTSNADGQTTASINALGYRTTTVYNSLGQGRHWWMLEITAIASRTAVKVSWELFFWNRNGRLLACASIGFVRCFGSSGDHLRSTDFLRELQCSCVLQATHLKHVLASLRDAGIRESRRDSPTWANNRVRSLMLPPGVRDVSHKTTGAVETARADC